MFKPLLTKFRFRVSASQNAGRARLLKAMLPLAGCFVLAGQATAQVEVTATSGAAAATYTSVNAAFVAINAGTHKGDITISLTAGTTEPAATPLVASGQGAASYTSVLIRPTGPVTITGTPAANRAVFEFEGADNVTINGDAPGGATTRDLTIVNNASNTLASATIRLSGATTGGLGATNIIIQNSRIFGNADVTSTSASPVQAAIYAAGTSSSVSLSNTGTGADFDNLTIQNNEIYKAKIGIHVGGTTANQANNLLIEKNRVGATTATDYVTSKGINISGVVSPIVQDNLIQNIISSITTNSSGIEVFSSTTSQGAIIRRNEIGTVHNLSTGGWAAQGIHLANGNDHLVENNEIYNIKGINYSATNTTFSGTGIRFSAGTGHKVYYNSVNLYGTVDVGTTSSTSTALAINSASSTNLDIRNNIFQNKQVSTVSGFKAYAVRFPSGYNFATSGLVMNNNAYFIPAANTGTTSYFVGGTYASASTTDAATLAAWSAYSQAATASNDALSIPTANQLAPFTSDTDLTIPAGTTTALESGGVYISALGNPNYDIILTARPSGTYNGSPNSAPDMGAYEFSGVRPSGCNGAPSAGSLTAASSSICEGSGTTLTFAGGSTDPGVTYQWKSSTTAGGPYTNVGSAGTSTTLATGNLTATTYYIVTSTCDNSGQSSSTSEFTITVTPNPVVSVSASSNSLCSPGGSDITLTASGATSYSWSPATGLSATTGSSVTATPTATTTYTVTGTANGCSATTTTTITVLPNVTFSPSASPASICAGGSTQLSAGLICPTGIKITEVTQFRTGTGATASYPAYTGSADDMVEISNLGSSPFNVGGLVFEVYTGSSMTRSLTIPAGTTIPAQGIMIIALGTGTNDAANRFFYATGTGTPSSGTAYGYVLKNGTSIVDAVATNSYSWPAASGVTASDWSGNIASSTNLAGVSRTGATDSNSSADWSLSSASSPQTVGAFNAGLTTVENECTGYTYAWSPSATLSSASVANPTASGVASTTTYTLTVTSPNGCFNSGTVTVTAGSPLAVSSTVAPATICAGQSASLTATVTGGGAPYNYNWTGPNGFSSSTTGVSAMTNVAAISNAAVAGSGTYTITVTDVCGSSEMATVNLTVNPVPTATATSNSPICTGGSLNLTGSTDIGTTFTWTGPNSFTSSSQNPSIANATTSASGTYSLTISQNGCTSAVTTVVGAVSPAPTTPAITASAATLCGSGSSVLSASATYSTVSSIGSGTAVNSNQTHPTPFGAYYEGTRTQYLVLASELTALGYVAGPIQKIGWNVTNLNLSGVHKNYTLSLKNTSASALTSTFQTGLTQVTTPVNYTPTVGMNEFVLTTPFTWDGTSNLVVETTFNNHEGVTGNFYSENASVPYTTTSFVSTTYFRADNNLNVATNATGTTSSNRANIYISMSPNYSWTLISGDGMPASANTASVTVNPTVTSTYMVTASNAANAACSASNTVTITVNSVPTATAGSNSPVQLAGTIQLSATGGSSYTWSGPNGFSSTDQNPQIANATAANAGQYTLTAVSAQGCSSSVYITVSVGSVMYMTINQNQPASSTNFSSFAAATSYLNATGIAHPTVIDVTSGTGPYTGKLLLTSVPGASATNTLTINGNGNTLTGCSGPFNGNRDIVRLDGTDFVTINGFVLDASACGDGWGVHLMNGNENVTISNNTILHNPAYSIYGANHQGIIAANSFTATGAMAGVLNNITISGNTINHGYSAIRINGSSSDLANNITIANNTLTGAAYFGIITSYTNNLAVTGNQLNLRNVAQNQDIHSIGIQISYVENGLTVTGNKVANAGKQALFLNYVNEQSSTRGLVANNMLGGGMRFSSPIAMQLNYANYLDVYFNSLNTDFGTGIGLYVSNVKSRNLRVMNNSIAYTGASATGRAMSASGGFVNFTQLNYNNYYSTGQFVWFNNALRNNLAELQASTEYGTISHDQQSMAVNPMYASATDLHLSFGSGLMGAGTSINGITTDFDGQTRPTPPSIGADEYTAPPRIAQAMQTEGEVYPNPFRTTLTVAMEKAEGIAMIKLVDMMGRTVYQSTANFAEGKVSLNPEVAQGVYLLQLTNNGVTSQFRVVKQ